MVSLLEVKRDIMVVCNSINVFLLMALHILFNCDISIPSFKLNVKNFKGLSKLQTVSIDKSVILW